MRNGVGVRVSSVSNVSIDSCIFDGNTSDGVNFYSSNGYVRYSNFVGNGVGIRFRSGSSGSFRYARVEYSDNGIWANGSVGIEVYNSIFERSNSPYIVSGHIGVDAGVKLRIESGVRVVFKGRYYFNVDGILEVEGAEGDSVVFTSLYPDTMRYPGRYRWRWGY